jgi:phosphohistidine phosphatase
MRLLLVRHGVAVPLGEKVTRDEDRPLTTEGARRFRQVAAALARLEPKPRAILTSPLLRARQTAEIAAEAWGDLSPEIVRAFGTGEPRGLRQALARFSDDDTAVLVGHEDWISELTARLLGSQRARGFRFRKGGVALIELESADATRGALVWFIPPRVFRRL